MSLAQARPFAFLPFGQVFVLLHSPSFESSLLAYLSSVRFPAHTTNSIGSLSAHLEVYKKGVDPRLCFFVESWWNPAALRCFLWFFALPPMFTLHGPYIRYLGFNDILISQY